MGFLGKCCSLTVVVVAVLVGLLVSGKLAEWDVIATVVEKLPNPVAIGMFPASVKRADLMSAFKLEDVKEGSLTGKVACVTGANSGVGYQTALHLARAGAETIMVCRSAGKCQEASLSIQKELDKMKVKSKGKTVPATADMSSLHSVRAFTEDIAKIISKLDILVLNAGIGLMDYGKPYEQVTDKDRLTKEGLEIMFATNHFGHFLMVKDFQPLLEKAAEEKGSARIVLVSSAASFEVPAHIADIYSSLANLNKREYDSKRYAQTKFSQIIHAQELSKRLPSNIFVNSLHPGAVETNIWQNFYNVVNAYLSGNQYLTHLKPYVNRALESLVSQIMWTASDGARTQFYLAASPEVERKKITGRYFHPIAVEVTPHNLARGESGKKLGQLLWKLSEEAIKKVGL